MEEEAYESNPGLLTIFSP
jgi:hypothetical protein